MQSRIRFRMVTGIVVCVTICVLLLLNLRKQQGHVVWINEDGFQCIVAGQSRGWPCFFQVRDYFWYGSMTIDIMCGLCVVFGMVLLTKIIFCRFTSHTIQKENDAGNEVQG
jgi:hypothetical protein